MIYFFEALKIRMSQVYFVIVFCVLTLYVHDGYYDLIEAKGVMLLWTTIVYVITMLVSDVVLLCNNSKNKATFGVFECCLLVFVAICIVSALLSPMRAVAFFGSDGCCVGALTIFLAGVSCISLSRYLVVEKAMIAVVAVVGIVVFALGITDCFDLDLFGWHQGIAASHYDYLSTIGNRDFMDGYLALVLPFFAVLFVFEKNVRWRLFYGLYLFAGFINLYIAKNDGNLLAFGCGIFLVYYLIRERVHIDRTIALLSIFIAASFFVWLMCLFIEPENVVGHSILGMLIHFNWHIGLVIVAFIMWLFRKRKMPECALKIWIVFSVSVIIGLFLIVVINFDLSFATDRGYIWSYGLESFAKSSVRYKLFGWGPDCYKTAVYSLVGERIASTWPEATVIANAHNEIIQYLVTTGVFGMLSYIAVFVSALFSKNSSCNVMSMAAKCSVFAYFCTALGNNPMGLNYGILFGMMALGNACRDY
ncbi:MAG: O-antigen ligase family protein [Lachnospiraceae bacterium]|nr:O-antigen ligase family protein [Lachnospiraceae bacterium]